MAITSHKVPATLLEAAEDRIEELEVELAGREPTDWLASVLTRRIVLHLKNDQSIQGSLVSQMGDGVVLRAAKLLDGTPQGTPMAGEVFVPRENVAFAQLDG